MIAARLSGSETIEVEQPADLDAFNSDRAGRLPCPVARGELVLANMALARSIAGRFARIRTSLTFGDLVGYGVVGILLAADRFDPSAGAKFTTFASEYAWGSILTAIRNLAPTVRSKRGGRPVNVVVLSRKGLNSIRDTGADRDAARRSVAESADHVLATLSLPDRRLVCRTRGIGVERESQAAIARARGVTKQAINFQVCRSFAELRDRFGNIEECA